MFETKGFVDSDLLGCASCNLAGSFVEDNGFERRIVVIVDGLDDGLRAAEDSECASCDVCLRNTRQADVSHAFILEACNCSFCVGFLH